MDVALMAYEAVIHTRSPRGERTIPIDQFYVAYGEDPAKENTLEPGELITAVDLPNTAWFARSTYVKARDRASYEFALASAAVALDISGTRVRDCRIAIGGVATKPWRAVLAEQALKGASLNDDAYFAAAQAEMAKAVPQKYNAFKVLLCRNVIVRALQKAAKVA
jgi:xanthine dehydrogenase YagS FAD-binding subunit